VILPSGRISRQIPATDQSRSRERSFIKTSSRSVVVKRAPRALDFFIRFQNFRVLLNKCCQIVFDQRVSFFLTDSFCYVWFSLFSFRF